MFNIWPFNIARKREESKLGRMPPPGARPTSPPNPPSDDSWLLTQMATTLPEAFGSAEPRDQPVSERGGTFDGGGASGDWSSPNSSSSSDSSPSSDSSSTTSND